MAASAATITGAAPADINQAVRRHDRRARQPSVWLFARARSRTLRPLSHRRSAFRHLADDPDAELTLDYYGLHAKDGPDTGSYLVGTPPNRLPKSPLIPSVTQDKDFLKSDQNIGHGALQRSLQSAIRFTNILRVGRTENGYVLSSAERDATTTARNPGGVYTTRVDRHASELAEKKKKEKRRKRKKKKKKETEQKRKKSKKKKENEKKREKEKKKEKEAKKESKKKEKKKKEKKKKKKKEKKEKEKKEKKKKKKRKKKKKKKEKRKEKNKKKRRKEKKKKKKKRKKKKK
jgi:hypothetical protein